MMRLFTIVATAVLLLATTRPAAAQISLGPIVGAATAHIGSAIGTDDRGSTLSVGGSVAAVESTGWGAEFDAGFANNDDGRTGGLDAQSYMLNVIGVWPKRAAASVRHLWRRCDSRAHMRQRLRQHHRLDRLGPLRRRRGVLFPQ